MGDFLKEKLAILSLLLLGPFLLWLGPSGTWQGPFTQGPLPFWKLEKALSRLKKPLELWKDKEHLQMEKETLARELRELQWRYQLLEKRSQELERWEELKHWSQTLKGSMAILPLLELSMEAPFSTLKLQGGRRQGLGPGMPVFHPKGMVGRLFRVHDNWSQVQSLQDPGFAMEAFSERLQLGGILRGQGEPYCLFQSSQAALLKVGDRLVSSGRLGSLPRGIFLGKIKEIQKSPKEAAPRILVETILGESLAPELLVLKEWDPHLSLIEDLKSFPPGDEP